MKHLIAGGLVVVFLTCVLTTTNPEFNFRYSEESTHTDTHTSVGVSEITDIEVVKEFSDTDTLTESVETDICLSDAESKPLPFYTYTDEELNLLARLIHSEGGSESYDTQLKIGSVVMNRVQDPNFPNSIYDVIYQENQFSVTLVTIDGVTAIDLPPDEEAKKAALEVLTYGSVLPDKVQVFYRSDLDSGWVTTRQPYDTFDNTAFAYIYPREDLA